MQRGIGNTNPIKLAKCIVELERILGITHGGDRKSSLHNDNLTTQADLAEELERIESARANERKVAGKGIDHKDGRPEGQARDIVASNFGISGRQKIRWT